MEREIKRFRVFLIIVLTLLFNAFFWQKDTGVNVLIYSSVLTSVLFLLNPESRKSGNVWLALIGTLLSGIAVAYHNSLFSLIVHILSLTLFVGFVHQPRLRLVYMAIFTVLTSYVYMAISLGKSLRHAFTSGKYRKQLGQVLSASLIPIVLISLSILIFKIANPRFDAFTLNIVGTAKVFIESWNIYQLLFNALVAFFLVGIVYKKKLYKILLYERVQVKQTHKEVPESLKEFTPAQKASYDRWFYAILAINIVLFVYHVIEIDWLWLSPWPPAEITLQQLAIKSMYLLVLFFFPSILALGYLWRRKAYFVHYSGKLRTLSLVWMSQQFVLLLSIMLRMALYVAYHGMTHARMLVILLLGICVCSLIILFSTIWERRATLYFLQVNTWVAYIIIVMVSLVNWDNVIATYNLSRSNDSRIDTKVLLTLSDKTLPILLEYRDIYPVEPFSLGAYYGKLAQKVEKFQASYENQTFLSWNWADYKTHRYFDRKGYRKVVNFLKFRERSDVQMFQQRTAVDRR